MASTTCPACGKRVQTGVPRGGDGSADVFFRHERSNGEPCPMSRRIVGDRVHVREPSAEARQADDTDFDEALRPLAPMEAERALLAWRAMPPCPDEFRLRVALSTALRDPRDRRARATIRGYIGDDTEGPPDHWREDWGSPEDSAYDGDDTEGE